MPIAITSEPGARPAEGDIPLCVPAFAGQEWAYVKECLDSGWVSSAGPFVERFERAAAALVGVRHAVATASGTAALHLALLVAGVGPDDEVLVPTLTFIAPANAVRYLGAHPVFVDVEPEHWQLDPDKVEDFLLRECTALGGALWNRRTGRRVAAILPVHLLGHPCDLDRLVALARRFGLALVEDATESLGARWGGQPVGAHGPVGCLSFNGNKVITTGGGGMLLTNDAAFAERARYLSTQAKDDPIEYVHGAIGYNYRLTNLQAALGCAQLEQLPGFLTRKRWIARAYQQRLADVPGLSFLHEAARARSACWMTTVLVDAARFGRDRRALLAYLAERRIQTRPLWQPLHRSPAHRGAQAYRIEVADRLWRDALSLPSSAGLTDDDLQRVVTALRSAAR